MAGDGEEQSDSRWSVVGSAASLCSFVGGKKRAIEVPLYEEVRSTCLNEREDGSCCGNGKSSRNGRFWRIEDLTSAIIAAVWTANVKKYGKVSTTSSKMQQNSCNDDIMQATIRMLMSAYVTIGTQCFELFSRNNDARGRSARFFCSGTCSILPSSSVHLRVCGGKGGFGSLLRGSGRGKAGAGPTNHDAMRDLAGRRLRHAEANDSIQRWAKEKEDRDLERVAESHIRKLNKEKKRKDRELELEKKYSDEMGAASRRGGAALEETLHNAVLAGMNAAKDLKKSNKSDTDSAQKTSEASPPSPPSDESIRESEGGIRKRKFEDSPQSENANHVKEGPSRKKNKMMDALLPELDEDDDEEDSDDDDDGDD